LWFFGGGGSRYLFGTQASWSEELARLLMVWLALLGSALVCREEKHLGLDVVVCAWPDELQRFARLFGYAAIFAFALLILGWGGWQLVDQRFDSGQALPALGVSRAWFYLALPVSGFLTALFMLELFIACLLKKEVAQPKEVSQ
jgi:TRAP-type C4-dicarboxylate transport system permease small subunit